MTAAEAFELITQGGASDFAEVVAICNELGPYCLIGGLAVNCYVEPVYTLDADLVIVSDAVGAVDARLRHKPSGLRWHIARDARYQEFIPRAIEKRVLGLSVRVASLDDVVQGKLWAWSDPQRQLTKRKKDELDLLRLAEAYPEVAAHYPPELRAQLG